MIDFFRWRY